MQVKGRDPLDCRVSVWHGSKIRLGFVHVYACVHNTPIYMYMGCMCVCVCACVYVLEWTSPGFSGKKRTRSRGDVTPPILPGGYTPLVHVREYYSSSPLVFVSHKTHLNISRSVNTSRRPEPTIFVYVIFNVVMYLQCTSAPSPP